MVMNEQQKPAEKKKLSKDVIKHSMLNKMSLQQIEQEYAARPKMGETHFSQGEIRLISIGSTFFVAITIAVVGSLLFSTLFQKNIRNDPAPAPDSATVEEQIPSSQVAP